MTCDPPLAVVTDHAATGGRLRLPVLGGFINAPTLRADGSILDRRGYDEKSALLFEPRGVKFPSIPDRPMRAAAEAALADLIELINDFPFLAETDRSVALSAILTACVRRSLRTAPLHGFSSPVPGTGKSKLVDIACVIATDREAGVVARGGRKRNLRSGSEPFFSVASASSLLTTARTR